MLDLLTKHFLILSSVVIGVASAISMLFLAAYMAVFDWSLIWLIEYTDLAKLFLIGTALLSSVITTMLNYLYNLLMWLQHQVKNYKWIVIAGLVLSALAGAVSIYYDIKTANGQTTYHAFRLASTISGVFLIYLLLTEFDKWKQLNWLSIVNDVSQLVLSLGIFGATFGYYVKDVSKDSYHRRSSSSVTWSLDTTLAAGTYSSLKVVATDLAGNSTTVARPSEVVPLNTSTLFQSDND
jgi:hypothetical protein